MSQPRISIGLPVYNGENYLAEAIESLLSQTFGDFELIISDNASEDHTQSIARNYAGKDRRIRYYRQHKNMGASLNYTKVFELTSGEYFKWAAHDDICAPEYLDHCVQCLDKNPGVAIAHTMAAPLYPDGSVGEPWPLIPGLDSFDPVQRFATTLRIGPEISFVWGVARRKQLANT